MNRSAHPFSERRRRVNRSESTSIASGSAAGPGHATGPGDTASRGARSSRVTTTVIVITRNDEPFIEDCIESLLVQSMVPDEIIVCDRASTDGTTARIARYGGRVSVVRRDSGACIGDAEALHAALQQSTGELVFLLNGHDRFKRDKIESYVSVYVANPDAALLQAPMDKIDDHGRLIGPYIDRRKHVVEHLKEIQRRHDVDFYYPRSALAFSRHCLNSILLLELPASGNVPADIPMTVVAPYFGRVLTLPKSHTEWRRPARNFTGGRAFPRRYHVQQTLMRAKVYNHFCRRHGLRPISPWQNSRFYLQLLRYSLPDLAYRFFDHTLHVRSRCLRACTSRL